MLDILEHAQFVVDAKGHRKAVVLDYALWEELMTILEDVEDSEELRRLRQSDADIISWEQAKQELREEGLHV